MQINNRVQAFIRFIQQNNWEYEQKENVFQLTFQSDESSRLTVKTHVITILEDKIYTTVSLGVKVVNEKAESETLKLINKINAEKIFYGRFVITNKNEIWFDFAMPLYEGIASNSTFDKIIKVSDNCCEHFGDYIFEVANQIKSFSEISL